MRPIRTKHNAKKNTKTAIAARKAWAVAMYKERDALMSLNGTIEGGERHQEALMNYDDARAACEPHGFPVIHFRRVRHVGDPKFSQGFGMVRRAVFAFSDLGFPILGNTCSCCGWGTYSQAWIGKINIKRG
jgi:hypothetical protein